MEIATFNASNFIENFFFGYTKDIHLHISHNDMDGYMCHAVTKLSREIQKDFQCIENYDNYHYINVANPSLVEGAIHKFLTEQGHRITKDVRILISDLGGLDFDSLMKSVDSDRLYLAMPNVNIYIGIYDHHIHPQINYEGNPKSSCRIGDRTRLVYFNNTKVSATKILANFLCLSPTGKRILPNHVRDKLLQFAHYISEWDTGNFGFWNSSFLDSLDGQVIYNLLFHYFDELDHNSYDNGVKCAPNKQLFIRDIIRYIMSPTATNILNDTYEDIVMESLQYLKRDFLVFKSLKVQSFSLAEALSEGFIEVQVNKNEDTLRVSIPDNVVDEDDDSDKWIDKEIHVFLDDFDFNSYAYSPYAQYYLKDGGNNAVITFRVNRYRNHPYIDMRSDMDSIDISKIAIANEGGGHKKAAGFPITDTEIIKD